MKKHVLIIFGCFLFSFQFSAQVNFSETTSEVGLEQLGRNYGMAIADYNNDGWDDIFAIRQQEPCQLYQNNGDGTFTEVSAVAGVDYVGTANGAAWADIDNDGWLDLMVANRDEDNLLFHSNQDGTFTNIAESAGVLEGGKVRATLFVDYDMDGLVDIYLARLSLENILYRNNGDLTFTEVTAEAGVGDDQLSMAAIFFDYDNDGDPDLYLTHDGFQPNILYKNLGDGTFQDASFVSQSNVASFGMGVDFGDVNNDGLLDLYITNLGDNFLLVNNGNTGVFGPGFDEIAMEAGVNDPGMGWGTTFLDCDNDGLQDIYTANDSYFSPLPNLLYRNIGNDTFQIVSDGNALASMEPSYGMACTDFNDDGRVDIYLANFLGDLGNQFFQNDIENENAWVKIKATGTMSNRSAIGAKVTLETGGTIHTDEIAGGSGFATQNSLTLHFGLAQAEIIDKLTIRWPNGLVEEYEALNVNTTYSFTEGGGFTTNSVEVKPEFIQLSASPNPFDGALNLRFHLPKAGEITLSVLNQNGSLVDVLTAGPFAKGENVLQWENEHLPAGLYLLRLQFGEIEQTVKVVKR